MIDPVFMRSQISIHAPREGSDFPVTTAAIKREDFNPRSP